MFLLFLKRVGAHYGRYISGAVVGGLLLLWDQYASGPQLPTWLFFLIVGAGLGWATFGAWKDEHDRAQAESQSLADLRSRQPEALLSLVAEGFFLFVDVRNMGAQGRFRAVVSTQDPGGNGLHQLPGIWDQTASADPFELGHNLSARVRVAQHYEDRRTHYDHERGDEYPPHYGWKVVFQPTQAQRVWYPPSEWLDREDPQRVWFTMQVTILSTPEMRGGSVSRRIRFVGRYAYDLDSSERHQPSLLVYEEGYDDEWHQ